MLPFWESPSGEGPGVFSPRFRKPLTLVWRLGTLPFSVFFPFSAAPFSTFLRFFASTLLRWLFCFCPRGSRRIYLGLMREGLVLHTTPKYTHENFRFLLCIHNACPIFGLDIPVSQAMAYLALGRFWAEARVSALTQNQQNSPVSAGKPAK